MAAAASEEQFLTPKADVLSHLSSQGIQCVPEFVCMFENTQTKGCFRVNHKINNKKEYSDL